MKSDSSTCSWFRRAASSAASLTRLARSAPTMPGVVAAIRPRSTSGPSGTPRVCTFRIASRPARSGGCTATRRSKRPGRSSAWSSTSGRLVAPITITLVEESNPSISVRIWFSVCSRSSLPPLKPATPEVRERPIASSSSMKTIAGAASFAWANRSRTREAPTPTIASTNSEAAMREERHVGLARDRPRQQRLAGARAGRRAARRAGSGRRASGTSPDGAGSRRPPSALPSPRRSRRRRRRSPGRPDGW